MHSTHAQADARGGRGAVKINRTSRARAREYRVSMLQGL